MLTVRDIEGAYGSLSAVRGVTFSVEDGGSIALLGRNGAGKSTVLKLIAGSLLPRHGTVLWKGHDMTIVPAEERVRSGIVLVPEGRGTFPGLTVEENLKVGAYWRRPTKRARAQQFQRVYELLPRIGERRHQVAGSLSGGEQQILALGRALMSEPELLLIDEPSLGLAPQAVEAVYTLLRQLSDKGIALVLVEQYVGRALELCDWGMVLEKGSVRVSAPAYELVERQDLVATYLGSAEDGHPSSKGMSTRRGAG